MSAYCHVNRLSMIELYSYFATMFGIKSYKLILCLGVDMNKNVFMIVAVLCSQIVFSNEPFDEAAKRVSEYMTGVDRDTLQEVYDCRSNCKPVPSKFYDDKRFKIYSTLVSLMQGRQRAECYERTRKGACVGSSLYQGVSKSLAENNQVNAHNEELLAPLLQE